MFQIIIAVLGIVASAVYIGFLAYSIASVPLWIIVAGTFALMIREFVVELRESAGRDPRGGRGR